MMKVMVALIMTGGLLLVGAGCSKEEKKEEAAAGSASGEIGVAECDEYIKKYSACIAKMPAAAKPTAEQGFDTQKKAWKAAASTPQGKEGLKTGCKMALDGLAQNALCK